MQTERGFGGVWVRTFGLAAAMAGALATFAPTAAHAWTFPRDERETQVLYQRLAVEHANNRHLRNEDLNRLRDGKRSHYIDPSDEMAEQADPLAKETLAKLPDAKWIDYAIFAKAVRGMRQILANFPNAGIRTNLLTIVDFNLKTESRRFVVVDLELERILFQTWVHHGRKSDLNLDRYAERFSNVNDSNQSSTGFLLTSQDPYQGMWGYSLRMHGIDGTLNSNVHRRAIVIHPWPTIHPRHLATLDSSSTSLGCLSLPWYESGKFYGMEDEPLSKLIIDTIKGRSVIFVSSPKVDLAKKSLYLKSTALLPSAERSKILARVASEEKAMPIGTEVQELPAQSKSWLKSVR